MSFTCPRCGMTSHNPNDAREGYCGNCHDWTGGLCACGRPLHYSDPHLREMVDAQIKQLGERITVRRLDGRAWLVPRHYIALHGLKADELGTPALPPFKEIYDGMTDQREKFLSLGLPEWAWEFFDPFCKREGLEVELLLMYYSYIRATNPEGFKRVIAEATEQLKQELSPEDRARYGV